MGTNSLTLNRCRVCQLTKEQHLLIECDTCGHYYHLSCLDPPLTRMPKKTKQMGWQCSDCCKSSDSDKAPEVDTAAPRRLRRNIKEPAKFSPSLASEVKGNECGEKSQTGGSVCASVTCAGVMPSTEDKPPVHLYHPGVASMPGPPEEPTEAASIAGKRRRSSDGKKTTTKKQKKSPGDTEHGSSEIVPASTTAEPVAAKTSPATAAARGKKGPQDPPGQDALQANQLETRSSRGRKLHPEAPPLVPMQCGASTAAATPTTTSLPERPLAAPTQVTEAPPTAKNRRGHGDSAQPPTPCQATGSPSRQRRQPPEAGEAPSRPQVSSPTRGRRHQAESGTEAAAEAQQAVTAQAESDTGQGLGAVQTPAVENAEPASRRRGTSSIQLDTSVESLPSVTSLHSPTSESFHSAEDDPSSPRKEKRHRDGSKKKKKDKDKELDGVKKRKKHHHRDKHGMGEMASEIVTPFRIKIKPLPPRPMEEVGQGAGVPPPTSMTSQGVLGSANTTITTATTTIATSATATSSSSTASSTTGTTSTTAAAAASATTASNSSLVTHSNYQTRTPPAGYPPLPPGYTLTQPMAPPSSTSSTSNSTTTSTTHYSTSSSQASTSHGNAFSTSVGSNNRRRSDPGDPQQFSKCDVCGETGGVTNTVSCDECNKAYHFNCLEPPLKKSPKRRGYSWFCEDCDSAVCNDLAKVCHICRL